MQIVIDIPEDMYNDVNILIVKDLPELKKIIANGIPLPKGHGDLIDRDKLEKDTEWDEYEDGFISYSHRQIFSEPVVIPADKGELDNEDSN